MSRELTHCFVKIPVKSIDETTIGKLRALENKLGCQLIAFGKEGGEYARLTEEQIKKVEQLAVAIDATIVAYSQRDRRPAPPQGP
jgi:hypothetical protein